jgi:hypothetical protein
MKYNSICCTCGRQTEFFDGLMEHIYNKAKAGYVNVQVSYNHYILDGGFSKSIKSLDFCPSCSKKSYTIEELDNISNYDQWSY